MSSEKGRKPKAPNARRTRKTVGARAKKSAAFPATGSVGGLHHDQPEVHPIFLVNADNSATWSADDAGVWVERNATTGQVLSLSHTGLPYLAGDAATVTDAELLQIATGYLRAANDVLGIPQAWLDALDGQDTLVVFPHWTAFDGDQVIRPAFFVQRRHEPLGFVDADDRPATGELRQERQTAFAGHAIRGALFRSGPA